MNGNSATKWGLFGEDFVSPWHNLLSPQAWEHVHSQRYISVDGDRERKSTASITAQIIIPITFHPVQIIREPSTGMEKAPDSQSSDAGKTVSDEESLRLQHKSAAAHW